MQTHIASVRSRRIAWDVREVVQHGLNADRVELALDPEWQECDSIVAVLAKTGAKAFRVDARDGFFIPSALMEDAGPLRMCLLGYKGDSVRIVTAKETAPLCVVESGEVAGMDPAPEQPDLWAQLMEEVRKATDGAKTAAQSATRAEADLRAAAERGDFDGEDGKTPVRGVDYWTAEDRKPIEDATLAATTAAGGADAAAATATEGEASRVAAEAERANAEAARAKAEHARESAETGRVEAEGGRVTADAERGKRVDASVQKADAANARATEAAGKATASATEADAAAKRADEAAKGASENVLVGNETATVVHVEDAWPTLLRECKVLGKSEQTVTTGKNMLDVPEKQTLMVDGSPVVFDRDAEGYVSGGENDSRTWGYDAANLKLHLDAGKFTLTVDVKKPMTLEYGAIRIARQGMEDVPSSFDLGRASRQTLTFNIDAPCEVGLMYKLFGAVIRLQLEKGATATTYEPYTGGKPSPSPDYPQEIANLNKAEIVTCGKNLINVSKEAVSDKCATQTNGYKIENGVITFTSISNWGADYIFFNEANVLGVDKLTFSMKATKAIGTSNNNGAKFLCKAFDSQGNEIKVEQGLSTREYEWGYNEYYKAYCQLVPNNTLTITLRPNIAKIRFGVCFSDAQAGTNVEIRDFQIEADSKATTYEPHKSKSTVIDLKGNELLSIPNGVRDEVVIDAEGNVSLIKRLGKKTYSGAPEEQWVRNGETEELCRFYTMVEGKAFGTGSDNLNVIADRFSKRGITLSERASNTMVEVGISKKLIPTLDAALFVAWLKENPTTFVYKLAEPQTIPLGKVELPALPESTSNIWNNGNIPANVYINYLKDVNIAFADLESKLTQAVVAAAANL